MNGSLYLSRLEDFKNQKRHVDIQEYSDDDEEESTPSHQQRYDKQPYNNTTMRLNEYGVPDVVPSNLGDSFAAAKNQPWQEMNNEDNENDRRPEGMMGLLNQFYDLNNNPTI
jgi:hypothetical protein